MAITISGGEKFEQCLDVKWDTGDAKFREFVVEMVLDRSTGPDDGSLQPAKDAVVKRILARGMEREASLKNMPIGRNFLVAVLGKNIRDEETRSPWMRMSTLRALEPKEREELGHDDPFNKPRMKCNECKCAGYTPSQWQENQTKQKDMRCRRCGCSYKFHELLNVAQVLSRKAEYARLKLGRTAVAELPDDALEWDDRECNLYFCTDGAFHPRKADVRAADRQLNGSGGKKGRVSVICPTTESRQRFHRLIWKCFDAQTWQDKELVVIETYSGTGSKFFKKMAKQDSRIIFASYQCPQGGDWSIGTKRNLGTHLATGEILANFDDDDLYAPSYLKTMVSYLAQEPKKKMVKLSSWYIFNTQKAEWGFCDPITWGLTQGIDETDRRVKEWAYGYGFSYVMRRQASLDSWYPDVNFGEDFGLVCSLPERKGKPPVALHRDEFGICLHVLHGENTSDSIPLRSVKPDEASRLEVMDLPHKYFAGLEGADCEGGSSSSHVPLSPRERAWRINVHIRERQLPMLCKPKHTALDFLSLLQMPFNKKNPGLASVPPWSSLSGWRIYRVPPQGVELEASREELATHVLGVGHLKESASSTEHWRSLLDRAKQRMQDLETLGIRVEQLWLRPPEETEARGNLADLSGLNLKEDFVTVHCQCEERSAVTNSFMLESFEVRVMSFWGNDVGALRTVLDWTLPRDAQILEELPGGEMLALSDEDPLPERVKVTEFRGRMPFCMKFSRDQALFFLAKTVEFLERPGLETRLNKLMEESSNFRAYNGRVGKILMSEVYPALIETLGLPLEHTVSVDFFAQALEKVARMDRLVNELQVKVTVALRTWSAARHSVDNLNWLRHQAGEEPYVIREYPFLYWPVEPFLEFCDQKGNLAKLIKEAPLEPPKPSSQIPQLV